jgi:hypothetical protein
MRWDYIDEVKLRVHDVRDSRFLVELQDGLCALTSAKTFCVRPDSTSPELET